LQIRAAPADREKLLDAAVARIRSAPAEDRRDLGVWLNKGGEFQRTLTLLPEAEALTRKDLFLVRLDALAGLGRWEDLQQVLSGRVPLEPAYAEAFRARCANQAGEASAAGVHWGESFAAATGTPEELWWLANYAERNGEVDTARRALRELAREVTDPRPVFGALESLEDKHGSTAGLLEVVDEMHHRWPDDAAVKNDCVYLNLLLRRDVAAMNPAAAELVENFPDNLARRTTLALAKLRAGDAPGALQVYVGKNYDWRLAAPAHQAVYAAILLANGNTNDASALIQRIPTEVLRPEERELLQK